MYELGHQPFSSLALEAVLSDAGHSVQIYDHDKDEALQGSLVTLLSTADALLVSVPMHTASAIAIDVLGQLQDLGVKLPICLFGLYAANLDPSMIPESVTLLASGEAKSDILKWLEVINTETGPKEVPRRSVTQTRETNKSLPTPSLNRSTVPSLVNYARLITAEGERLVGYTEASRGCSHSCTHCPVPVVYGGRMRINAPDWVLADIEQLVSQGASHITFGDPDFFNAPIHAMRIVRELHRRHPSATFDATIKVQHLIDHQKYLGELKQSGCSFIVSAFEHVSEQVLSKLRKEHNRADIVTAVALCRKAGIEIRPSLLPFTPWTTPDDIIELFLFLIENSLISNVDPIQLTIRLLVPKGSLLMRDPNESGLFEESQGDSLNYTWKSKYSELDHLQSELGSRLETWLMKETPTAIFDMMYQIACEILGRHYSPPDYSDALVRGVPKLTESWFCCAEPAETMLAKPRLSAS